MTRTDRLLLATLGILVAFAGAIAGTFLLGLAGICLSCAAFLR